VYRSTTQGIAKIKPPLNANPPETFLVSSHPKYKELLSLP